MLNQSYTEVIAKAKSEYSVERANIILNLGFPQKSTFTSEDIEMKVLEKRTAASSSHLDLKSPQSDDDDDSDLESDIESKEGKAISLLDWWISESELSFSTSTSVKEEEEMEDKPLTYKSVQQIVSNMLRDQQEMIREALAELKNDLTRQVEQQTLDLILEEREGMQQFMARIERMIPQTEFEYVYR